MIVPGPLDNDNGIQDVVFLLRLVDHLHRQLEEDALVFDGLGLDEQVSEVISHHPLRSMLGRINADDGKVLTTHFLDTRTDDSVGLLQRSFAT